MPTSRWRGRSHSGRHPTTSVRDIAVRYLGTEMGEAYLASNPGGDNTLILLTPQHWHTVDYTKLDIPTG